MNIKRILFGAAILCFLGANAQQIKTPQPSPKASVEQTIGLKKVEIDYSRPSVKGRVIFGDLVPFDKLWRTGANQATKITVNGEIMLGGNLLKKGEYSIFTIPNKTEWTVVINSNAKASVSKYNKEKDLFRLSVSPTQASNKIETFTIQFANLTQNSADLQIMWDKTVISIPVTTNVDKEVMKKIDAVMAGPSSRDLYLAAKYYYENEKELEKAVKWINKSVDMDDKKQKFWVLHLKAKILAKSGDKIGAKAAAEKSKELAKAAEYDSYVKMNEELIESLK